MAMFEKTKEVEKMIATVMKKKECTEKDAIVYMLGVATGRLNALWRYDASVPDGKDNKGVLKLAGKKKPKEKSAIVSTRIVEDDKPAKPAAKPAKVRKAAKRKIKAKPSESAAASAA